MWVSIRMLVILALADFCRAMPESYDTIVVGLGSAGVTAATILAKAGKRVLGLEAMDRIGGRVKTVPFGDGFIEEGAEWIHGTENSRVYQMAIDNNIPTLDQELEFEVYRSDGTLGNNSLISELVAFCHDQAFTATDKPLSLGEFITGKFMEHIKIKYPELQSNQTFIKEFLNFMNLIVNNYEGSNDWTDVSAKSAFKELGGHQHMSWHRYGYKTFFELLLNTYNNGPGWPNLDIKLNSPVSKIIWPRDSTGNVIVQCEGGQTYTARHVIVTVSLGVLKERHEKMFEPALPIEKTTAIDKMSIGVMDKVILKFEKPWWDRKLLFFSFLWRLEDIANVSKEDYWITRILGASNPMGSDNTLTLWTSGDVGKMVETLPDEIVIRKTMELLRKFMGKKYSNIPEPTGMLRSKWYSNPYTRGSYTYDNLDTPNYPHAREALGAPLLDSSGTPRVLFAGEATNPIHFSTVAGASDTGYREAMRLLPSSKM
ncbi:spermine oxidase-like isoform X3 [Zerene cesonia]|uniref:spermine oxidase-like isoform X3 n=1 Tax=Zerene cesonia TaxID=33412 RepID=UPI0018E4EA91|nr:spermine oxidase-like isoform X3 [Zerene cesonia]